MVGLRSTASGQGPWPRECQGAVSLTFDDGPNPDSTPRILDTLKEKQVRATFFILGSHA